MTQLRIFDDIQVLDLSTGMAGPMAALVLADNGAKVIKVEPPEGEWGRGSKGFRMWNRGKQSVTLDLSTPDGLRSFHRLAAASDIVIESFRPGVAERLGVDFKSVRKLNPKIVYASISGFGSDDPGLRRVKGYENIVQALSGRLNGTDELHGAAEGQDQSQPIYQAVPVCSYAASQLALTGMVAALRTARASGVGQRVCTSLLQGAAALVMRQGFGRTVESRPKGPKKEDVTYRGVRLTFMVAQCKDGKWIQMCARQDHLFRNWLKALELDEVINDPRYARAPMYIESIAAVEELEVKLRARMRQKTQGEWMQMFVDKYDVGADPFLTPAEFLAHPQMTVNDRTIVIEDAEVGPITEVGPLALFSDTPSQITQSSPALGANNRLLQNPAIALAGRKNVPASTSESTPRVAAASTAAPAMTPKSTPSGRLPLEGITVLELAYFLAGPVAATVLAEMGARVIKVETPEGDPWRRTKLECTHVLHGKESIVIDLKSPGGREVLHKLIAKSDILLTSFRPQVHAKLGFDYETASRINPRLIHVYSGAYGSKGPWNHRAGFHSTPQAMGGAGILQAGRDNAPVDDSAPDPIAALGAASAMVMALAARDRTGRGQYVETTMLCSNAYAQSGHLVLYNGAPEWELPDKLQKGQSALNRLYECREGWLMIGVMQEDEWQVLVSAVGQPKWAQDARFAAAAARKQNDAELTRLLSDILRTRTADDWEKTLTDSDVPAVRADRQSLEEFLLRYYRMTPMSHPEYGDYWRLPNRIDFPGIEPQIRPACSVGEQTVTLLAECGYDAAAIQRMIADGTAHSTIHTVTSQSKAAA